MRMVFAPDGRTLVTTAGGGEVIVWDVAGGRVRERLTGHTALVSDPAISPDGRTLYTAGRDAKLTLWDLAGDRRLDPALPDRPRHGLRRSSWSFEPASRAGVSPDGGTVAVTQRDGSVELRDARTLAVRRSARVLDGEALAAAYTPDGGLLAVSGADGRVAAARRAHARPGAGAAGTARQPFALSLAISPDGRRLATAVFSPERPGRPGRLRLWDLRSGKPIRKQIVIGHGADDLAFSPDSRLPGRGPLGSDVTVFAAEDGRKLATVRTGHDYRSVGRLQSGW